MQEEIGSGKAGWQRGVGGVNRRGCESPRPSSRRRARFGALRQPAASGHDATRCTRATSVKKIDGGSKARARGRRMRTRTIQDYNPSPAAKSTTTTPHSTLGSRFYTFTCACRLSLTMHLPSVLLSSAFRPSSLWRAHSSEPRV
eukprot:scaffold3607_cov114-Isochrysis_galbana.AAC.24